MRAKVEIVFRKILHVLEFVIALMTLCVVVGMLALVPALRTAFDLPAGDSLLAAVIVLAVMILLALILPSILKSNPSWTAMVALSM